MLWTSKLEGTVNMKGIKTLVEKAKQYFEGKALKLTSKRICNIGGCSWLHRGL